ncbi:hypothetical protein KPSA3_06293 [Pseudomonas syringae pv. actinidiae]|uniref:Uncharacterized protein n=1 Tax=Pseudomonas syringae pv. actinidiae TaxID=103796 RepID=A0AAN4QBD2_PSESF|nr:hypothetical protein KPSA3_06293 [Pseudomonas syringae pv. actinidiae]
MARRSRGERWLAVARRRHLSQLALLTECVNVPVHNAEAVNLTICCLGSTSSLSQIWRSRLCRDSLIAI